MKKLFLAITLIGLMSCSNDKDEDAEIINTCDCMKTDVSLTVADNWVTVTPLTEPYITCEQTTNGEVKPYDPNFKKPAPGKPAVTVKAYKITCP